MDTELLKAAKDILNNHWNELIRPTEKKSNSERNAGFDLIGLAHYDVQQAMEAFRFQFRGQWKNGMLPDLLSRYGTGLSSSQIDSQNIFPNADANSKEVKLWASHLLPNAPKELLTSGIVPLPIHGFALLHLYEKTEGEEEVMNFLKELYPKVKAFHQYLYTYRDPLDEGLITIRHPLESGMPDSPIWEETINWMKLESIGEPTVDAFNVNAYLADIFRKEQYDEAAISRKCPYLIQDPLFNAVLVASNEALTDVALLLGEDISELVAWNELTIHSITEKLWDEKRALYNAYDLRAKRLIVNDSISAFMPLFGGVPTVEQAERMVAVLLSKQFCGATKTPMHFCPTYRVDSEAVDFEKPWKGAISMDTNWLLYKGLTRYLFINEANQVKDEAIELLFNHGFHEYFDPRKSSTPSLSLGEEQFPTSASLCIDFLLNVELF